MSEMWNKGGEAKRIAATATLAAAIGSALFLIGAWVTAPSSDPNIVNEYWQYVWLGLKGVAALTFISAALAVHVIGHFTNRNDISHPFHACDGSGATTPKSQARQQS